MLKRVAHWAEHFEICQLVVLPIPVPMMHAEHARLFLVPATLAVADQPARSHGFANRRKGWFPYRVMRFIDACSAAIFSFLRRGGQKGLATMLAVAGYRSLEMHGFVVASARTVFCPVSPRCNVRKRFTAHRASGCNLFSDRQRAARSRAVFESFPSVLLDPNRGFAMPALHHLASGGWHAAR